MQARRPQPAALARDKIVPPKLSRCKTTGVVVHYGGDAPIGHSSLFRAARDCWTRAEPDDAARDGRACRNAGIRRRYGRNGRDASDGNAGGHALLSGQASSPGLRQGLPVHGALRGHGPQRPGFRLLRSSRACEHRGAGQPVPARRDLASSAPKTSQNLSSAPAFAVRWSPSAFGQRRERVRVASSPSVRLLRTLI
jgi:hypothetical protein